MAKNKQMSMMLSRAPELQELMEDDLCDREDLCRTFKAFSKINIIAGWTRIYARYMRPYLNLKGSGSLLDVGFGGGDIPILIKKLSARDGYRLDVTAIDLDPRALNFINEERKGCSVNFRLATVQDLLNERQHYDFVISNHLLHHLAPTEFDQILKDARRLASHLVIFNDIERSFLAYWVFKLCMWPFFRRSFVFHDGLTSIRRSYSRQELSALVSSDWQVLRMFPSRLLLLSRIGDE